MTAELKQWITDLLAEVADLKRRIERDRNQVRTVIACKWSQDRTRGVELTMSADYNYQFDQSHASDYARFRYGINTYSDGFQTSHGLRLADLPAAMYAFNLACAAMPERERLGDWAGEALKELKNAN